MEMSALAPLARVARSVASQVFMTPKRIAMLRAINKDIVERGYAPSRRELQASLSIRSLSAVQQMVDDLAEGGYIDSNTRTRGIRITSAGQAALAPAPGHFCPHCHVAL